jgi:hypothetical protein
MAMGTVKPARLSAETMPQPDPHRARLAGLRQQLDELARRGKAAPVGSQQRDSLAEQYGEVLACLLALTEEVEG